jgi:two-component system, OmpR family, sensor histidine kinase PhoQ
MISLRARLLLAASVVLSIFIVVAGLALENAFYKSAEQSLRENLRTQLNLLMAGAELDAQGNIDMPARLLDTKFGLPSSGLYGIIVDPQHKAVWKSLSTVGIKIPEAQFLPAGETVIEKLSLAGEDYLTLSYGVDWYTDTGKRSLAFNIITELRPFNAQLRAYRRTLSSWLIGLAVALLLTQLLMLMWVLQPLRTVRHELRAIDRGTQARITGGYPSELRLLTENINDLIDHEHAQQSRYRNALADLAHSLKTPLAVLRGAIAELPAAINNKVILDEQIQRMDHIVAHQLQRAATAGKASVRQNLDLTPLVQQIIAALTKVYRDKGIHYTSTLATPCPARIDAGDAMEILGNLLDNASKWSRHRVTVSAQLQSQLLVICVEDDGAGVPDEKVAHILTRGGRIDEAVPGQGIGLSVAHDIINRYDGKLRIERSRLGGAKFCFELPVRE